MDFTTGSLSMDTQVGATERFDALVSTPGVLIERIVSRGHATPRGEWFDQETNEWVLVVSGSAGLRFESEASVRTLRAGDYVNIPAHCRHRVEWTDSAEPTVWLAVHYAST